MDYKRIFKNERFRMKILNFLSFVPDKTMLKIQYKIKTGRKLNLKNPQRFTEKIQWYKLNYRNPIMQQCADKYDVRDYVKSKGLGHLLNECYGVFNNPDEIDFEKLPEKFVLKDTLGAGCRDVIICTDKSKFDIEENKKIMWSWVNKFTGKTAGREWVYQGHRHRIIAEKFIETDNKLGLIDYKFFTFNGKAEYIYIICNRKMGSNAEIGIYNSKLDLLDVSREDELPPTSKVEIPKEMDKMFELANMLGKDFPHTRVDFYNEKGKIIFGELTFFASSGYMIFNPDKFDFEIGEKFKIKNIKQGE